MPSKPAGNPPDESKTTLLFFLYFLSGFTALNYEVLWLRGFSVILGSTIYAMSCVVTEPSDPIVSVCVVLVATLLCPLMM